MGQRAGVACRKVGCPGIVRAGVCSRCGPLRKQAHKLYDDRRGSAASRGYDRRWRAARAAFLRGEPLCVDCLADGFIVASSEAHHIVPVRDGGTNEEVNLMALCKTHHSQRTGHGE